ncbi:hypothetical protein A2U01_0034568, partial [Trifolium medium]|nr:hypothetical protein [Trifolium medium]
MRPGRYVLRGRIGDNRINENVTYPFAGANTDDILECNENREDDDIPSNNYEYDVNNNMEAESNIEA